MNEKPYKCSYPGCDTTFKSKRGLAYHLKYIHNFDESKRLPCPIPGCNKSYKNKKSLEDHIRDTHSDKPRYQCSYPGCSNAYKHLSSLKQHIRATHSSSKYQCPIPDCNQTFTRKNSFSDHLKYVHDFDESKRILCPIPGCVQSFKRKADLYKHIRTIHQDTTRLKCPYPDCNKTYQRRNALNAHIRFEHQDYRPHVCEKCGKEYKRLTDLKYHLDHNLCWSTGRRRNQSKIMTDHHKVVNQWKDFLKETKNPKSVSTELTLPNNKRLDVLAHCPNNRWVGFDVTIGRKSRANLRNQITEKFERNYEQFCNIIYIVVISKVKKTLQTIQECNRSPTKPKMVRVVHWRAIVRDNPKYSQIFQQIEDESVL